MLGSASLHPTYFGDVSGNQVLGFKLSSFWVFMTSIILSFVGNQDPVSDKTREDGSIVSLMRYLLGEGQTVQHMLLLYTTGEKGTQERAELTKAWLMEEPWHLSEDDITLQPVEEALSQDPINQFLAVQAARQAIATMSQHPDLRLEMNGSSGTPAMKSAWSILQATGDARHGRVWQVRNPADMQPGQERVFRNDVNALKNEFDSQVIQQQIKDYNYSGAGVTLQASNLDQATLLALLQSGFYRLSFDFDRAFNCLEGVAHLTQSELTDWRGELSALRQKDLKAILKEIYFNGLIRLRNQRYADFLVSVFQLQEQLLDYLVNHRLGLNVSGERSQSALSWQRINQVDQGKLRQHLETYRLPKGGSLDLDRGISRYVLLAIVEYYAQFSALVPHLKELNRYCELRNRLVHGAEGVSAIEDEAQLLTTLHKLMKQVVGTPTLNPFDRFNQQLCEWLQGGQTT